MPVGAGELWEWEVEVEVEVEWRWWRFFHT